MIVVQESAAASATVTAGFVYTCRACGFEGEADATGSAMGSSSDVYGATGGVDEEAAETAANNAQGVARDIVRAAPCPACGKRAGLLPVLLRRGGVVVAILAAAAVGAGLGAWFGSWMVLAGSLVVGIASAVLPGLSLARVLSGTPRFIEQAT